MSNTVQSGAGTAAPLGLLSRFIGIITSPRATFESVVAHPKVLGMLALTVGIIIAGTVLPMTTEAGKQATLETQIRQMESFGVKVNDQMYDRMQQGMSRAPYTTAASILVFAPVMVAIMSGILFAIFTAGMGGTATYKQVMAVVVHAGVVSCLSLFLTGPLNYIRGTMVTSVTNLGALLPFAEGSFIGRVAGMIDIFRVWWVIVLAMGLAVLYRRRTQPIAITFFAIYAVIALVAATVMSRFGGN